MRTAYDTLVMEPTEFDLCGFSLLEHNSLGHPGAHSRSLELFRDNVIRPSLRALDAERIRLSDSDDPTAVFLLSDLDELFQISVEGYLLTVQSMWEKGLRSLLIAREHQLCEGKAASEIQRAVWRGPKRSDLHAHFERLMGFSIAACDVYADLHLLQCIASAARHGDGPSAKRLQELCPGLWWSWSDAPQTLVAEPSHFRSPTATQEHTPISLIKEPEALLEQMTQAVTWFWEDMEYLRCMSFRRRHISVESRLRCWPVERALRASRRYWPQGSR